ncbi:MAG: hypothetical protein [Anelloviridae sp.]|nr:MAG: hypothetical protein [Anelloviridae sp.]
MSLSGNGAVTLYLDRLSEIPARRPVPVESLVQYKQLTRRESRHRSYSTAGTTDEGTLATQVLKECQKNQNLLRFLQDHQANAPAETPTSSRRKKNSKKKAPLSESSSSCSPGSTPVKKRKAAKKRSRRRGRYKNNYSSSSENSEPSESSWSTSPDKSSKSKQAPTYTPFYLPKHKQSLYV